MIEFKSAAAPDAPLLTGVPPISPLMLSDRLIALARDAEEAGCGIVAGRLVSLACDVLDQPPRLPH